MPPAFQTDALPFELEQREQFVDRTAHGPAPGGSAWSLSDSNRPRPACKAGDLPERKPRRSGGRIRTSILLLNRELRCQVALHRIGITGRI